jgi:hypothetical protein
MPLLKYGEIIHVSPLTVIEITCENEVGGGAERVLQNSLSHMCLVARFEDPEISKGIKKEGRSSERSGESLLCLSPSLLCDDNGVTHESV